MIETPSVPAQTTTGAGVIAESVRLLGIDHAFVVASTHNLPILEALRDVGGVRLVSARHEQGTVYMADAFARVSGRPALAITSTGPGAANAMGALVEAASASSPVLYVTAQVPTQYLGRQKAYLHEVRDQVGMLATVCKAAITVTEAADVAPAMARAGFLLRTGRPGPVAVEFPIDVQNAPANAAAFQLDAPVPAPDGRELDAVAERLGSARRPVIFAGGGVLKADAAAELTQLAEMLDAAVITSIDGRGAIPEDHPLCIGPLLLQRDTADFLAMCDLMLAVGTRFDALGTSFWTAVPASLPLIQVDIDGEHLGRNARLEIGLANDARAVLSGLCQRTAASSKPAFRREVGAVRRAAVLAQIEKAGGQRPLVAIIDQLLPRDAVVVKDVTISSYTWGNRLLPVYQPRRSIYANSSAIGVGVPMAVGAKAAAGSAPVVAICGDGGFMLTGLELTTAVESELPVVILLFNDGGYGVLRNEQVARGAIPIGTNLHTPDFVQLAEALGAWSRRAESIEQFRDAFAAALGSGRAALVEIMVGEGKVPAVEWIPPGSPRT